MKQKVLILNTLLSAAVLFSMLLQSVHSMEHLSKLFSEKECHHKYTGSTEFSHQHHPFDHCFTCEFTLSSFLLSPVFKYKTFDHQYLIAHSSFYTEKVFLPFKGSLFALRAPPSV